MLKTYLGSLWKRAHRRNTDNIIGLLEVNPRARLLDLGCDDGRFTLEFAAKVGTTHIDGCDFVAEPLRAAAKRGIKTALADLNQRLPYPANRFDVVVTNQVIEHLYETDTFIEEIYRVLKPGGYAVISTESLSSWHNLAALAIGLPAFSQHVSSKKLVGNPLSLLSEQTVRPGWSHVKIFNLHGLEALLQLYGFRIEAHRGAGYYPLPAGLANQVSKVSPGHSAFIVAKGRKPAAA